MSGGTGLDWTGEDGQQVNEMNQAETRECGISVLARIRSNCCFTFSKLPRDYSRNTVVEYMD